MGQSSDAVKYLEKNAPIGEDPYAVDEKLLLAEIAFDANETKRSLELLSDALMLTTKPFPDTGVYDLREALAKVTAPAPKMRSFSQWGNSEWFTVSPSELYNIVLCKWYVNYMQIKVLSLQAMAHFSLGNTDEAILAINQMKMLDPDDAKLADSGLPSNFTRLRDGFSSGRLYAESQELAIFKGKERPLLLKAELAMEMEQWGEAERLYQLVKEKYSASLSVPALAYLDFAIASTSIYRGDADKAKALLKKFDSDKGEFRKTSTYWRSIYARANLEKPEASIPIYEAALKENPPSPVARQLRFSIGQVAVGVGDNEKARKYFNAIISEKVDDYRTKAAHQYIIILDAGGLEAYQQKNLKKNPAPKDKP
jgi:tetratricopeptide (TPR) repeat protein